MYLGIDLGTSAVKVVLADENDSIVGDASAALEVSRPAPLHSEQDPEDWWTACDAAIRRLGHCLLYTSPSPRDRTRSRMPSSA